MIIPGLVSVTFRKLAPAEIVALMVRAGLRGVEWGGDIHVPHGDLAKAREVRDRTVAAGLTVAAYGSYYRVGLSEASGLSFDKVLASAAELHAPTIRVWAGGAGSAETSPEGRRQVADDLRRIAGLAAAQRISISLEFHANTLTDSVDSTLRLLTEVNHPNVYNYWQPIIGQAPAEAQAGLVPMLPRLTNVHVFHWPAVGVRGTLAEGVAPWRTYFDTVQKLPGDRYAMLEFVQGDEPEQLVRDAATLTQLLAS
ncbi:MAG: sugar phosphate isomerase/epimerase [Opitutae bacterium]|nr:sugar phosphate isomerase/epimerase [Opitutae bacterium]